jgi:hypothetical protein
MLEQFVLLGCVHQTICDNIDLCELRLADAMFSADSVPPLAPASLPGEIVSCEDLRTFFSQLEALAILDIRSLLYLSALWLSLLLSMRGKLSNGSGTTLSLNSFRKSMLVGMATSASASMSLSVGTTLTTFP